jgi:hypothetical protein
LFDTRPEDTPNAPIDDHSVERWYRSIGLFVGKREGKPLAIHLLKSHDGREFAILINGKKIKTLTPAMKIRVAMRFLTHTHIYHTDVDKNFGDVR